MAQVMLRQRMKELQAVEDKVMVLLHYLLGLEQIILCEPELAKRDVDSLEDDAEDK